MPLITVECPTVLAPSLGEPYEIDERGEHYSGTVCGRVPSRPHLVKLAVEVSDEDLRAMQSRPRVP
jgi:hypothetical protein